MDILDKKKLSILLKKIKVKNFSNKNNEEINLEIIKKIKDLSKKEKNKKRKEQLDLLEKKYDLKILRKDQLDKFGKLLNKAWMEKKNLSSSITNPTIDKIYNIAIKNGALGGKLLGAGGGGFFIFYVPYFKQKKFIKRFKKFIPIPFKFTSEGSKIMFNNFEK